MQRELLEAGKLLRENTRVTHETRDNTIDIVHLLKGMKVFGALCKWLTVVAGAGAAIVGAVKLWKLWP